MLIYMAMSWELNSSHYYHIPVYYVMADLAPLTTICASNSLYTMPYVQLIYTRNLFNY